MDVKLSKVPRLELIGLHGKSNALFLFSCHRIQKARQKNSFSFLATSFTLKLCAMLGHFFATQMYFPLALIHKECVPCHHMQTYTRPTCVLCT
jgi:hypothetical protein